MCNYMPEMGSCPGCWSDHMPSMPGLGPRSPANHRLCGWQPLLLAACTRLPSKLAITAARHVHSVTESPPTELLPAWMTPKALHTTQGLLRPRAH